MNVMVYRKIVFWVVLSTTLLVLSACDGGLEADAPDYSMKSGSSGQASLYAEGVALQSEEIQACNGIIHVTETVLLHPAVERMVLTEVQGIEPTVSPEIEAAEQAQSDKVTICHATHSDSNPYVEITIARSGLNGHSHHEGDAIPAPVGGCGGEQVSSTEIVATTDTAVTTEAEVTVACEGSTIADLLRADARFSTFVDLLEQEGLMATLEEPGPFTVFAPTNAAFEALPADVLARWRAEHAELTTVLLYHVVVGQYRVVDLQTATTLSTLNQGSVDIVIVDGTVYLNRVISVEAGNEQGGQKVTICHRTSSDKNPYNLITVDESALSAHAAHGDIIPAPGGGCPSD